MRITAYKTLRGEEGLAYIPELARLRIEVFREYPYLYEGDLAYEENYLQNYARIPDSVLVLAFAGSKVVGASTAQPLRSSHPEFVAPFEAAQIPPDAVFYLGESVLEPPYRGQGAGHVFFDEREKTARALPGCTTTAFCAVERPPHHPARPADYRPLDGFWKARGYQKHPDLFATFRWKECDANGETPKKMVFWLRSEASK